MRIFVIKHKGSSNWQNMAADREITFSDNKSIYAGLFFLRKKDAQKYLNTLEYKEFYEIIGATVDNSNQDNRKRTK
jgi:hypothetical protein